MEVTLPHGLWSDGLLHRTAVLRPIDDEWMWAGPILDRLTAHGVTRLLTASLVQLGERSPVTAEEVASLTAGDRDALLLHLYRLARGDRLNLVLTCPSCGAAIDLALSVAELLLLPYEAVEEYVPLMVGERLVRLRPITGADLEAIEEIAALDEVAAAELLLRRCLLDWPADRPLAEPEQELLSQALQALDPQAELLLDFTCTECGALGQKLLDPAAHLERELTLRRRELLLEVHYLAQHYHWSESEILAVPRSRRRLYLQLLGLLADPRGTLS